MSEADPWRGDDAAASAQRLGVPLNASLSRLRVAFRVQALRWHPDRNTDPAAHDRFREAREAYCTLATAQSVADRMGLNGAAAPMACEHCGTSARSLRLVTVTRLQSYILFSRTATTHEVHCYDCARQTLLKASFSSGALGSWSVVGLPLALSVARRNTHALREPTRLDLRLALHQPAVTLISEKADAKPPPLFGAANIVAALAMPAIVAAGLLYRFG